jgi:hypothetical protein
MSTPHFNGPEYVTQRDHSRLSVQYRRIFDLMKDGVSRTLPEISAATNAPPASVSAQLRHMRKKRFGSHTVLRFFLGNGLYSYKLVVNPNPTVVDDDDDDGGEDGGWPT